MFSIKGTGGLGSTTNGWVISLVQNGAAVSVVASSFSGLVKYLRATEFRHELTWVTVVSPPIRRPRPCSLCVTWMQRRGFVGTVTCKTWVLQFRLTTTSL